jgi:alkaline phosphatase
MNLTSAIFNKKFLGCFILSLIFFSSTANAQPQKYTTANAHSHNDYLNDMPFNRAYNAGFGSIEADVFPVNGVLLVAHNKDEIKPERTLRTMYLLPILKELTANESRNLSLLVDIKEDYKTVLPLLIKEVEGYEKYISTPNNTNRLTIVISGRHPPPNEYKNYPDFILFDDDLKLKHTPEEWNRVGLVSLPFNKISTWKGEGNIIKKDKKAVRHKIDSVHSANKPIRFWAAPDTEDSWKLQMKLHADLIGTDKIDELGKFLEQKKPSASKQVNQ